MVKEKMHFLAWVVVLAAGSFFSVGCASSNSINAPELTLLEGKDVHFDMYDTVTFVTFELAPTNKKPINYAVAENFTKNIATRVEHDFGPIFSEVRYGEPLGQSNELVVSGTITEYNPGDRFMRGMLIGLGAAGFKGNLTAVDGRNRNLLLKAKIDKVWAWGGLLGMSKGIEEMVEESAASAAKTIVVKKGWKK